MSARPSKRKLQSGFKTSAREVAARYPAGKERKLQMALRPLGSLETYPHQRIIVLHRGPDSTPSRVNAVLKDLARDGVVEFVTPVLIDRESNLRQVLTDEIILQLKPGRSKRALKALTDKHGVSIGKQSEFEPSQYVLKLVKPAGTKTLDVARQLDRSDDVEFAAPNFLSEIKR